MHQTRVQLPLVVDLDGTLIANDILHETASRFLSQHPLRVADLARWTARGKAVLKRELWNAAPVRVEHFRYHPDLLTWLRAEKEEGRTLVLASASDLGAVQAVADHLGIFDYVIGSDGTTNLRSVSKADALAAMFADGYEYVGNSSHDYDVWDRAAVAHVVSSDRKVTSKAGRVSTPGRVFPPTHGALRHWVKALRPHQWVKNALILLPLLTAQKLTDLGAIVDSLVALVAFCLAASSVYVLNDIADVENDRDHPTKRLRPLAAGSLSLSLSWAVWPVLCAASLALSVVVSPIFTLVLATYLVITVAYSFSLKRKPVIDTVTLAALYTIRIVAGAAAIDVTLSMWLLSFSGFFFLSLALVKRVSELFRTRAINGTLSGRGYQSQDLELLSSFGVATSVVSSLVFTLFVNDPATAELYDSPRLLWASVPILLAWLMRVWLLAHRGEMNEDPILFAIKDKASIISGVLIVGIFLLATFGSF